MVPTTDDFDQITVDRVIDCADCLAQTGPCLRCRVLGPFERITAGTETPRWFGFDFAAVEPRRSRRAAAAPIPVKLFEPRRPVDSPAKRKAQRAARKATRRAAR